MDFSLVLYDIAADTLNTALVGLATIGTPVLLNYLRKRFKVEIDEREEARLTALSVDAATFASQALRSKYQDAGTDEERQAVNEERRALALQRLTVAAQDEGRRMAKRLARKGAEEMVELGVGMLKRARKAA